MYVWLFMERVQKNLAEQFTLVWKYYLGNLHCDKRDTNSVDVSLCRSFERLVSYDTYDTLKHLLD